MKKTVSYSKSQLLDDLGRLALMVLASVIMAVNLKSFVQAGDLVPGGFNGLTLLIQRVALRFWGLSVPFSAINFLLNAVPAVISFKLIGKRFTLFSCVVILCTSLLTDLIPPMPITDDVRLICIFGGLITGFAIGPLDAIYAVSGENAMLCAQSGQTVYMILAQADENALYSLGADAVFE